VPCFFCIAFAAVPLLVKFIPSSSSSKGCSVVYLPETDPFLPLALRSSAFVGPLLCRCSFLFSCASFVAFSHGSSGPCTSPHKRFVTLTGPTLATIRKSPFVSWSLVLTVRLCYLFVPYDYFLSFNAPLSSLSPLVWRPVFHLLMPCAAPLSSLPCQRISEGFPPPEGRVRVLSLPLSSAQRLIPLF